MHAYEWSKGGGGQQKKCASQGRGLEEFEHGLPPFAPVGPISK